MTLRRFLREAARRRASRLAAMREDALGPGLMRYVEQAADAFGAPIALVSLLHDDEQLMLASIGLPFRCMPRQEGFCRYAVDGGALLEVCDATADPRFAALPSVTGEPGVRYYLGAPILLFGQGGAGALCVVDVKPRLPASPDQRAYLAGLSRQVGQSLERRLGDDGDLAA